MIGSMSRIASAATADELVSHHGVAALVVDEPARVVIRHDLRVIHVVDVGGADRGAERLQQHLAGTGDGIGRLPDLETAITQHHCTHVVPRESRQYGYAIEFLTALMKRPLPLPSPRRATV